MVFNMTATRFMPGQETPGVSKKRPFRSLFHAQDKISSGLVYDFLDGILGFANGLLGFALALLQGALNLKVRIAHGFAGALFDRAGGLVSHALDLVGSAAHDWSPDELMAARSPSTACNQRIELRSGCAENDFSYRALLSFLLRSRFSSKTCDIKDPAQNIDWEPPEGGGGPNYPNM
jgi:hypothetical protein